MGPKPTAVTHRGGGGDLLGHDLQGVDHGDVAQTLGDGQGSVAVLRRAREQQGLRVSRGARRAGASTSFRNEAGPGKSVQPSGLCSFSSLEPGSPW